MATIWKIEDPPIKVVYLSTNANISPGTARKILEDICGTVVTFGEVSEIPHEPVLTPSEVTKLWGEEGVKHFRIEIISGELPIDLIHEGKSSPVLKSLPRAHGFHEHVDAAGRSTHIEIRIG
jgi:hypothetical protein